MKKLIVVLLVAASCYSAHAQKYFTKNARISFNATSSIEKIEANNEKGVSTIDASTGAVEYMVLMKGFIFDRALMQDHFNENYVESDKFPKATFKGTIINLSDINLKKDGTIPVKVKGMMTIHGETKEIITDGTITIKDGNITSGKSAFKITLADYKIEIPSLVKDKISKDVQISVEAEYLPYKAS
jgi:polyisoprenoid-binding protein YceI